MTGLPAGKKPLAKILSDEDDAHCVIDLVILLDYLLSSLGEESGSASTRERVDRNAKLFKRKKDVHFGITVRNRLAHTDAGEAPATEKEVRRAREHLVAAVQELEPHLSKDLQRAVSGGRFGGARFASLSRALLPAFAFFGAWQLFAVTAGLLIGQFGGLRGGRWFTLLVGLVVLNQLVIPRSARWVRGVTLFLRLMFVSHLLGLVIAVRGLVLWSSGVTQTELVDGYCDLFGRAGDKLEAVLGLGVWAFAPWLVLSREETWAEITRFDGLSVAVYLAPILLLVTAYLWAFRPAQVSRKAGEGGATTRGMGTWVAYGLGVFLIAERAASLLS